MLVRSNLVFFSLLILGSALLMHSCASSSPPDRLVIHVQAQRDVGILHVDTCVSGASSNEVYADDKGIAKTSLCPASNHTVDVEVVAGEQHHRVASTDVQIHRTGDGIATSVEARFTSQ